MSKLGFLSGFVRPVCISFAVQLCVSEDFPVSFPTFSFDLRLLYVISLFLSFLTLSLFSCHLVPEVPLQIMCLPVCYAQQ